MEPESKFYASRRLRLHYLDWGSETRRAPPLILVHGGLDHSRSWDWTARELRQQFRVLAVDLAGHGDSDHAIGGNYQLPDFILDIAELYRHESLERATLIGHSMGGAICALFAGSLPHMVERLILIEGLRPALLIQGQVDERIRSWIEQMRDLSERQPRAYETVEQATQRMLAANSALTHEQALHLTVHGLKRGEDGLWRWKYDNFIRSRAPSRLPPEEVMELWSRIACPTLLIGGDASGRPDPSKNGWLTYFRDATSVLIPGAGHWAHHDRFEAFLALAQPFLMREKVQ